MSGALVLSASRALLAAWAAREPLDRVPEGSAVANALRTVAGYRESVAAARARLPRRLRVVTRDAEALLLAAGLDPAAEPRDVEAARRALAHVGDRHLRAVSPGRAVLVAEVTAEVRSLMTRLTTEERCAHCGGPGPLHTVADEDPSVGYYAEADICETCERRRA